MATPLLGPGVSCQAGPFRSNGAYWAPLVVVDGQPVVENGRREPPKTGDEAGSLFISSALGPGGAPGNSRAAPRAER